MKRLTIDDPDNTIVLFLSLGFIDEAYVGKNIPKKTKIRIIDVTENANDFDPGQRFKTKTGETCVSYEVEINPEELKGHPI